MCTLIAYYHLHAEYPLIVAANRDEQRNRGALPPHCLAGKLDIYAGRDTEGGGTWLGINTGGLLVGITNRRSEKPLDTSRRSRGLLCLDALSLPSARAVYSVMETLGTEVYNPFNLFYADQEDAFVTYYDGKSETRKLGRGLYVLASRAVNDFTFPRISQAYRLAEKVSLHAPLERITDQLQALCRDHKEGVSPRESICVHNGSYGTVSSTIIVFAKEQYPLCYLHAAGNPCLAPYQDYSFLFT